MSTLLSTGSTPEVEPASLQYLEHLVQQATEQEVQQIWRKYLVPMLMSRMIELARESSQSAQKRFSQYKEAIRTIMTGESRIAYLQRAMMMLLPLIVLSGCFQSDASTNTGVLPTQTPSPFVGATPTPRPPESTPGPRVDPRFSLIDNQKLQPVYGISEVGVPMNGLPAGRRYVGQFTFAPGNTLYDAARSIGVNEQRNKAELGLVVKKIIEQCEYAPRRIPVGYKLNFDVQLTPGEVQSIQPYDVVRFK